MTSYKKQSSKISVAIIATLLFALVLQPFHQSVVSAAPADTSESICTLNGGEWKNLAPTGGVPEMGCSGISIAKQQSLDWQIKSLLYYRALGKCFKDDSSNSITADKVSSNDWFIESDFNDNVDIGPYMRDILSGVGDDGNTACVGNEGKNLISSALSHWGISNRELLCGAGYTWKSLPGDSQRCINASPDSDDAMSLKWKSDGSSDKKVNEGQVNVLNYLKNKFYSGSEPDLNDAGWYSFYRKVFFQQCATNQASGSGSLTKPTTLNNRDISIWDVGQDGSVAERWYRLDKDMVNKSFITRVGAPTSYDHVNRTCEEIAKDYLTEPKANTLAAFQRTNTDQATKIETPPSSGGETAPSCGGLVEGIGWIVCPVLDALGGMNDAMWGFVSGLLTVDPLQQNGTMYDLWQKLQAIANVLLVIVFLFIIFSQLTGAGISNYGIKKMLPRLVIIAIAINLSYLLISIAVDVFNIIGTSIYNILNGLADQSKQPPSWEGLIGLIVGAGAGGAIAVGLLASSGGITAALLLLLPLALAAAIGFLVAVVTLLLRQALIPLLAVLAPVAFVLYLLPNTNQWFTKWRKTFISMLLLFPIAAFLFGGLKLAAIAIAGDSANWLSSLTALVVMAVPLFTLPYIARQAGPVLGKIGNNLNGMAKKLQNPVAGWSKSQAGLRAARNDLKPTSRFNIPGRIRQNIQMRNKRRDLEANAYKAQGEANYNEKLIEHADDWATGVDGSAAQAYIRGAGARAQAEEMKAAQIPLTQEVAAVRAKGGDVDKFLETRALDSSRSNTEREAAIHQAAALGRDAVVRKFLGNTSVDQSAVQRAITANAGSLSGKAPDLVKGAGPAFSGFSGQDMSQWSKSTAEAYIKHIKNLQNTGKTAEASKALADFASAARDIQANPNLQGVFSSDTGNEIKSQAAQLEASDPVKFAGIASAFGAIGPDGKIR